MLLEQTADGDCSNGTIQGLQLFIDTNADCALYIIQSIVAPNHLFDINKQEMWKTT